MCFSVSSKLKIIILFLSAINYLLLRVKNFLKHKNAFFLYFNFVFWNFTELID